MQYGEWGRNEYFVNGRNISMGENWLTKVAILLKKIPRLN